MTCRICDGQTESVLDLGELYPSNFVTSHEDAKKYPLHLVQCRSCELVQLKESVELDLMYRQYWYKSSLNSSMLVALKDVVVKIEDVIKLGAEDVVMDIGCNDGSMLTMYTAPVYKIGVDPAINLGKEARTNCDRFINDYFSLDSFIKPDQFRNKVKVITSIAMFYDLEDPNKFIEEVKYFLHAQGIWVIQFTDLVSMLKANAFDNICHEHIEYYSLKVLVDLLARHNLRVFKVEYNKVNGGSVRAYVTWGDSEYPQDWSVNSALEKERQYLNSYDDPLQQFAERVEEIKIQVTDYLMSLKADGKVIYALGASTKGNTTLQYFGLYNAVISKIAEVNPDKYGLYTIGTNIPIIPEEQALAEQPDCFLILPWHFGSFFKQKLEDYLKKGGQLCLPMPTPMVIKYDKT